MIPGAIVASLGALGTIAVKSAVYITLPDKVEAVESTNAAQDKILDRITVLLEQNEQQESERRGPPWYDLDNRNVRRICHDEAYDECWRSNLWQRVK